MTFINNSNINKAFIIAQKVAANCSAYKDFLNINCVNINHTTFNKLPITDKYNYLNRYPLTDRLYKDKKLCDYYMICTSSGSTGESTLWPRDYSLDQSLVKPQYVFLNNHFQISRKKTLILISLSLGTAQAGMMHLRASWGANKLAKVSVISPNGDAEMTIYLIQKLYREFDQVICLGYPPLVTDFLDLAVKKKMPIHKWHLKIGLTGESISSIWRREVIKIIHGSYKDIISWYGSTETGMIGFETPEANTVLSHALTNDELRFNLFNSLNLPTLIEVDSINKYVELVNNEIVITADQTIPLVRYCLHDTAKIITNLQMKKIMTKFKVDTSGISNKKHLYLAVFGRNNNTVFKMEDIRQAIDNEHINYIFHQEFQYDEEKHNKTINLKITLYKKKKTRIVAKIKKQITQHIKEYLQNNVLKEKKINLALIIRDENKRLGYKSGKLRYLLSGF